MWIKRPNCAKLRPVSASLVSRNLVIRRAANRMFKPVQFSATSRVSATSVFLGDCLFLVTNICIYIVCKYMEILKWR